MSERKSIHVVVGAGQVGPKLADELLRMGKEVRIIRRGEPGASKPGLTWYRGDATDAAFMDRACQGAEVIYHCANPVEYHKWDGILQPLFEGVLGAATRAGAKLVMLDNLYMIGEPETSPFDESVPMRPKSKKGALRKALVEQLFAAHARGEVIAVSGRASDFYGPSTPLSMLCSTRMMERLQKGQPLEYLGNPDLPRSYSYTPDVAKALAILGTSSQADGKIWNLPVLHDMTSRRLLTAFAEAVGHSGRLTKLPGWMFRLMGLFVPMMRAIPEMLYQWEIPYEVDDSAFRETFGMAPTPLRETVAATLRSELPGMVWTESFAAEVGRA